LSYNIYFKESYDILKYIISGNVKW